MKAIETRYKGYRFRSRLEARWAVFFDAMDWAWEYEAEGFAGDGIAYLPDFVVWMPIPDGEKRPLFVEIKPRDVTEADAATAKSRASQLAVSQGRAVLILFGPPGEEKLTVASVDGKVHEMFALVPRIRDGIIGLTGAAAQKARSARFEHGEHP